MSSTRISSPLVLASDEYDAIHGELEADLHPSLELGMLLPADRRHDLGDYRRAIRRLQTKVDVLDALEEAGSGGELPPFAASDLRELLPEMVAEVDREVARGHDHPDDQAAWEARRRAVHAVADRLGVEIPREA